MDSHTSTNHNFHPTYRPDIDGLRSVAILSVLAFHAFPSSFKGGYVGVDVFFVISGYLISSIIFKSIHKGSFSFIDFYAHRVNRIFPALALVFVASYAFGLISLFPDELKQLGEHMSASAGFVQNIVLWKEAGYFDSASVLKPMMHLWSLSIEEQFYLIYPLVIWSAWRFRVNILITVVLLGLISFSLNVYDVETDAVKTFFLPQTRFWELLVGGTLAYLQLYKHAQLEHWLRKYPPHYSQFRFLFPHKWKSRSIISVVGFTLIVISVFGVNKGKAFPGWWALFPVFGSVLLVLSGPTALVNRKILSNQFMVFVGLISYPLYLWHWPLLSFAWILENQEPAIAVRVSLVLTSILLAWITYRFVEKPIRSRVNSQPRTTALSILMLLVVGLGYATYRGEMPWQGTAEKEVLMFEFAKKDTGYFSDGFKAMQPKQLLFLTRDGKSTAEKTLFVGDSNMGQYAPRIGKVIRESSEPTNGAVIVTNQPNNICDILRSAQSNQGCKYQIDELIEIAQDENIQKLVIAASWGKYQELLEEPDKRINLEKFINMISLGKKIFIIENIPGDPDNLPVDSLIHRRLSISGGKLEIINHTSPISTYLSRYGKINTELLEIATATGATLISPTDYWCNHDFCPALGNDGVPIYMDNGHITATFSRANATFIDQTIQP